MNSYILFRRGHEEALKVCVDESKEEEYEIRLTNFYMMQFIKPTLVTIYLSTIDEIRATGKKSGSILDRIIREYKEYYDEEPYFIYDKMVGEDTILQLPSPFPTEDKSTDA